MASAIDEVIKTELAKVRQFRAEHDEHERLRLAVVEAAQNWRRCEVFEFETDSCKERETRHYATNSALCGIRRDVIALNKFEASHAIGQKEGER